MCFPFCIVHSLCVHKVHEWGLNNFFLSPLSDSFLIIYCIHMFSFDEIVPLFVFACLYSSFHVSYVFVSCVDKSSSGSFPPRYIACVKFTYHACFCCILRKQTVLVSSLQIYCTNISTELSLLLKAVGHICHHKDSKGFKPDRSSQQSLNRLK